jgi:hypothetical protein
MLLELRHNITLILQRGECPENMTMVKLLFLSRYRIPMTI